MFSAKNGREMVIGLSPKQIRAQLATIERLRTPPKATPAGPTDKSSEPKKISSGGR
jgi:hypothetical protein